MHFEVCWALNGYVIILGSRSPDKAEELASELIKKHNLEANAIIGADHIEAAKQAEVIVLCTPFPVTASVLEKIRPESTGILYFKCII